MAPHHQSGGATDKRNGQHPTDEGPTNQIRPNSEPRTSRGEDQAPVSTKTHQKAGHMASTTWHTVEFSRNRRSVVQTRRSFSRGFLLSSLPDCFSWSDRGFFRINFSIR